MFCMGTRKWLSVNFSSFRLKSKFVKAGDYEAEVLSEYYLQSLNHLIRKYLSINTGWTGINETVYE